MKLTIVQKGNLGTIVFNNDEMRVRIKEKDSNSYLIPEYKLKKVEKTLFSTPINYKHKPFTKKKNINLENKTEKQLNIIKTYWSPFKENDTVEGVIKDNIFYITR
jgi:hypothetical protein